jgi:uncharacterized protein
MQVDAGSENVAKLQQAYQLWHNTRGASAQHWLSLMADDVVIRALGGAAAGLDFTRPCQGKTEAERYFSVLALDWEMIHFSPEEFIAQGDRVVVLSRCAFRFRRTGKIAESPKIDLVRFRNGMIVEFTEFFDTAKVLAAVCSD